MIRLLFIIPYFAIGVLYSYWLYRELELSEKEALLYGLVLRPIICTAQLLYIPYILIVKLFGKE